MARRLYVYYAFFHIELSAATTLALVHAKGEIFDYLITEW